MKSDQPTVTAKASFALRRMARPMAPKIRVWNGFIRNQYILPHDPRGTKEAFWMRVSSPIENSSQASRAG